MAKLVLDDIVSGYATVTKLNSNNGLIEAAIENTLSRDGTSPNQMDVDLDMNGHSILNLAGFSFPSVPITFDTEVQFTFGYVLFDSYCEIVGDDFSSFWWANTSAPLNEKWWGWELPDNTGDFYLRTTTDVAPFTYKTALKFSKAGNVITTIEYGNSTDSPSHVFSGTIRLGTTAGSLIRSGTGSPESVVTAPVGSLYLRTDGGTGTTLYIKESGTGNTGWIAK